MGAARERRERLRRRRDRGVTATAASPPVRAARAWWAAIGAALAAAVAGIPGSLALAMGLTAVHCAVLWTRGHAPAGLPLQVRLAFLGLLAAGAWPPLAPLHALQCAGVAANVAFDYCLLGRVLSLAPWHRSQPLTAALMWRTLLAPPGPDAIHRARRAATGR